MPRRPIHSGAFAAQAMRQGIGLGQRVLLPLADFSNRQYYLEHVRASSRSCARRRSARTASTCAQLPDSLLRRRAPRREKLFAKLDQWGYPALVIPHGTTWGIYTPPGSAWDKQLNAKQHDPERQRLIEVYSGPRQLRGVPRRSAR